MIASIILLIAMNKFKINKFLPYLVVGILLWDFTHQSGIRTIAGVLLALTIPNKENHKKSLLLKLEHNIAPYVAFGIMLFSLC